jgi:hypothetical protein
MESVIGVISLVIDSLMVQQVQAETVNITQTEIRMRVVVTGHTKVSYCMILKSPLKSIGTSRPVQFLQPDHMGYQILMVCCYVFCGRDFYDLVFV